MEPRTIKGIILKLTDIILKVASLEEIAYRMGYIGLDQLELELKPKYVFVNYADPTLGIEWADVAHAEVSEADKNHPLLKDVVALQPEQL